MTMTDITIKAIMVTLTTLYIGASGLDMKKSQLSPVVNAIITAITNRMNSVHQIMVVYLEIHYCYDMLQP